MFLFFFFLFFSARLLLTALYRPPLFLSLRDSSFLEEERLVQVIFMFCSLSSFSFSFFCASMNFVVY